MSKQVRETRVERECRWDRVEEKMRENRWKPKSQWSERDKTIMIYTRHSGTTLDKTLKETYSLSPTLE